MPSQHYLSSFQPVLAANLRRCGMSCNWLGDQRWSDCHLARSALLNGQSLVPLLGRLAWLPRQLAIRGKGFIAGTMDCPPVGIGCRPLHPACAWAYAAGCFLACCHTTKASVVPHSRLHVVWPQSRKAGKQKTCPRRGPNTAARLSALEDQGTQFVPGRDVQFSVAGRYSRRRRFGRCRGRMMHNSAGRQPDNLCKQTISAGKVKSMNRDGPWKDSARRVIFQIDSAVLTARFC